MDHEKFRYKKEKWFSKSSTNYAWYVIGAESKEGVHFHGVVYHDEEYVSKFILGDNNFGFAAHGIEAHKTKPMYEGQNPIKNCQVTGGDCYCDGSSLQASERLGWINPEGSDDETIYRVLEGYYRNWIEGEE